MMTYMQVGVAPRVIVGNGWSHAFARFDIVDRQSGRVLGTIEAAARGWFAELPDGRRTEFTLPSRKQAAEWILTAPTVTR